METNDYSSDAKNAVYAAQADLAAARFERLTDPAIGEALAASPNLHMFKKPYIFEGETYNSIDLDFDPLTGKDMIAAAKQYSAKGNFAVLPAYDVGFCAMIAARAANKPAQFIEGLPLNEFNQVTSKVTRFLTQAD